MSDTLFKPAPPPPPHADWRRRPAAPRRTTTQLERVLHVMADGVERTLSGIQARIRADFDKIDSEAAISARLRELRSRGLTVDRRRARPSSNRWFYRVTGKGLD